MSLNPAVSANDHSQGDAAAPLTLVEYGDYECSYCGLAYPIVKEIQVAFGKQLRFVFRNFPLKEAHPHAEQAAWLAEGAAGAGVFWPVHDLLYENQSRLKHTDLTRYGQAAGMSAEAIDAALSGAFSDRVSNDFRSGVRSGVNGTPTFFINGKRHNGSFEAAVLTDALQAALGR
jgi:protein-disulfide isomerase